MSSRDLCSRSGTPCFRDDDELIAKLRALLEDLTDDGDCWYDHHGYCQEHGWFRVGVLDFDRPWPAPSSPADWPRLDESPASSAQMIQWHAPKTWAAILATAVDLDSEETGDKVHAAIQAAIADNYHGEPVNPRAVADVATPAVLAWARQPPQPVEQLVGVLDPDWKPTGHQGGA